MRAKIAGMAKKLASFVIQPIHGYSPVRNGQTSKGKQTNQNYRHNAGHEIKIYFGSFSAQQAAILWTAQRWHAVYAADKSMAAYLLQSAFCRVFLTMYCTTH